MRLEAERYRINDAIGNRGDADLYSLGLVYRFGGDKPVPVQKAPPPVVAVAEPVLVIVPVKVKTAQYCSVLDLQFEIKMDVIQREDKEKLAVLGAYMNKYPDTTALIEGHSDDIGTSEFNQKLSQQRADSVVSYMVDEMHIDPSMVLLSAMGRVSP